MNKNIGEINKCVLLSRLHYIKKLGGEYPEKLIATGTILNNFKILYPNIDMSDLKERYFIPLENGETLDIHHGSYSEYAIPYQDGYKELLDLQVLCSKYHYPLFSTMVGDKFYCTDDFKEYEVIYIQEKFGSEQLFVLCNFEYNKIKTVKVNEYCCGKVNSHDDLYHSKETMLNALLNKYTNRYKDDMQRIDRLKKEL